MAIFNIMMDMSLKHKSSNWYKKKKSGKFMWHIIFNVDTETCLFLILCFGQYQIYQLPCNLAFLYEERIDIGCVCFEILIDIIK